MDSCDSVTTVCGAFEGSPESSSVKESGDLLSGPAARQKRIAKARRDNRFAREKWQKKQDKHSGELWMKGPRDTTDLSFAGTDFKGFVGFEKVLRSSGLWSVHSASLRPHLR
jgi:hypothetical protein